MNVPETKSGVSAQRYLTFRLADEVYGVRVLGVQEIMRLPPTTFVPQLPAHVRGVFNLRGRIIPAIDLRRYFGLPDAEDRTRACVVVAHVDSILRGTQSLGLVVDAVEDMLAISAEETAPPPDFGRHVNADSILGIARVEGAMVALLDLGRLLSGEHRRAMAAAHLPDLVP